VVAASDLEAHVERAITRVAKLDKKQLRADEKVLEAEIDEATRS
jgi:hypothetical protein